MSELPLGTPVPSHEQDLNGTRRGCGFRDLQALVLSLRYDTPDGYVGKRLGSVPASAPAALCNALMHTRTLCSLGRGPPGPAEAAGVGNCDAAPEATALVPTLPQAPPSLTFAMFAIPGVAGLADALIRPWRVLANGIDVAMVSPFHTLIHIWQGQRRTCEDHHTAPQVSFEGVLPQVRVPSSSQSQCT